ncbi:HD domain-containing protein [Tengunoibacter tsumagoiensis]|uniref:Polynucleotide adenylyltransferase n=1 Tax=Tengunoibacter tsumagoiensis TaxID=2014871 RepID=A0A402A2F3_9CHLR|nr:HD domain-containing protein [Tengunoibacter tsumagoiensis]GCE13338.1 polynucleotide adenylyltransferase [Tengunoibacter tsumagoiensis]
MAIEDQQTSKILPLLEQIAHYLHSQQSEAYLVGGSVRNLLFHEPCTDWDIVLSGDVSRQARDIANLLGGFYAHMHDKARRVVLKRDQSELVFDFAPLHGSTLEEDLRQRDFTLNAMAISLDNLLLSLQQQAPLALIDPLSGAEDLQSRTLRVVNDTVFRQDALRMLRAIRFRMRYQLTIEPHTASLIQRDAHLLPRAAVERIHEELFMILRPPQAIERLRFLDQQGLLLTLIPELQPALGMPQPSLHYWDVFDHSLETVAALEYLADHLLQPASELAQSPLDLQQTGTIVELQRLLFLAEEQGIFSFEHITSPTMKLGALLHDIGKTSTYAVDDQGTITFYHHPQTGASLVAQIMTRLGASTQERRLAQQIAAHHMRPGQLSQAEITQRAIRRYFVDLGPAGISVAIVALADHLAMRGPQPLTEHWQRHLNAVLTLLTRYICERDTILPPRLLQADELIHRMNLQPGPIVGQLLEAISEAQSEGQIRSKEEALWFAEEFLQHNNSW